MRTLALLLILSALLSPADTDGLSRFLGSNLERGNGMRGEEPSAD
jgi:hypothetical protein